MTGEELRRLRHRLGWTQAVFAVRLGLHPNTVARQERNEHQIPEPVARLARLLAGDRAPRPTTPATKRSGKPRRRGMRVAQKESR